MTKTYLITGGAGFIGSHLSRQLIKEGNNIINIDNFCNFYDPQIKEENIKELLNNSSYKLYRADIRDTSKLKEIFDSNKIDAVIHIAAMAGVRPSIIDPLLYNDVNVIGTLNILDCMKEYNIKKLIFASSSSVYGNNEAVPFKETDNVDFAISPYAATKKACEINCHVYHHLYNIDVTMLRFFTVYGPNQRPDLAIHKFTKMIHEGIPIPFYGDGSTERDYTYIDDIIDGVKKAIDYTIANNNVYEIFNIGESHTISLNKMVEIIEQALNKKAVINKMPMQPGDVKKTFADIRKAKRILGYDPQTNFTDGINKFVKWYFKENEK